MQSVTFLRNWLNFGNPLWPSIQYDNARRLVRACPEDFRKLVQAALLTGCRYSELARLKCGNFNSDSGTLAIRLSKGKVRHVVLTDEAKAAFEGWTAKRSAASLVFLRDDGNAWGASHQKRPLGEASAQAQITPAVNFHILRHSHGSHLAMNGVLAGEVHLVFIGIPVPAPHIKAGRLRALAVLAKERSPILPDVPTAAEAGLPDFDVTTWYGILAPAGTPRPAIARLNAELVKVMHSPEMKERLAGIGTDPLTSTPEEFAAYIQAEIGKWGDVIRKANLRAD